MILMGLAFGIIFPLGMVLGVRRFPEKPPLSSIRKPVSNLVYLVSFIDRPITMARPCPNDRSRYCSRRIFPRPCTQGPPVR
jgi:hypothetical protein